MMTLFWIFVGLMLGWVVIPQPSWAQTLKDFVVDNVKKLFSK